MSSPADLVTVAQVQAYIGTPAANVPAAKLQHLVTSISRAILAYINRTTVLPKTYTETRDGNPRGIMLRNWPVLSISSVMVGLGSPQAMLPSVAGSRGYLIDTPDDPPAGQPQTLTFPFGGVPKGDSNVSITYSAGYQVTGEAWSVPASSPYQVTTSQPYGAWAADSGVTYANGTALTLVAGPPSVGQYSVALGVYTFAAADEGAAVLISYGYVPADLANACFEWIADRLAYQDRIAQRSKSFGGQETVSFNIKAMPDFVQLACDGYRNVVPIL